jgi:hypothetical protein
MGFTAPTSSSIRSEGGLVHAVERQQREAGEDRRQGRRLQPVPMAGEQDEEGRSENGQGDHAVIAAGQEREHEEERGQESMNGAPGASEAAGEEHDERQPLRAQRAGAAEKP